MKTIVPTLLTVLVLVAASHAAAATLLASRTATSTTAQQQAYLPQQQAYVPYQPYVPPSNPNPTPPPAPSITTSSIPAAAVGQDYATVNGSAVILSGSNGSFPYVFSAVSGFPSWLSISAGGELSGTPPLGSEGSQSIVVRMTDGANVAATKTLTLTVNPAPAPLFATGAALPRKAYEGAPYSFTPSVLYGAAPFSWSLTGAPAWLAIDSASGELNGTAPASSAGDHNFTISMQDASGASAVSLDATLTVAAAPSALPFAQSFEGSLDAFSMVAGLRSRAGTSGNVATDGVTSLKLDGQPGDTAQNYYWNVLSYELANNVSGWDSNAPFHQSSFEWVSATAGLTQIDVSFDWLCVTAAAVNTYYANLVFEVNEGAGWVVHGGSGANSSGVYRGDGTAAVAAPHGAFNSTSIVVPLNGGAFTAFRVRGITKYALPEATLDTCIYVDNISVIDSSPFNAPTAAESLVVGSNSAQTSFNGAQVGIDLDPVFSAVYADPDMFDEALAMQVQVALDASFISMVWDSGMMAIAPLANGARSADIAYAGAALSESTSYFWRARFQDDDALDGAWNAAPGTFITLTGLSITVASMPTMREGEDILVAMTAAGGVQPFGTWTLVEGSLPAGVSMNAGGVVHGAPAAGSAGNYQIKMQVVDAAGAQAESASMTLTVLAALPAEGEEPAIAAAAAEFAAAGGCAMASSSSALLLILMGLMGVGSIATLLRRREA